MGTPKENLITIFCIFHTQINANLAKCKRIANGNAANAMQWNLMQIYSYITTTKKQQLVNGHAITQTTNKCRTNKTDWHEMPWNIYKKKIFWKIFYNKSMRKMIHNDIYTTKILTKKLTKKSSLKMQLSLPKYDHKLHTQPPICANNNNVHTLHCLNLPKT